MSAKTNRSDDFEARLLERERALGLAPGLVTGGADATPAAAPVDAPIDAPDTYDRWGNLILDVPPGQLGQYRVLGERDGRVLRVCGEAATTRHREYDADEMRYVCSLCFPMTTPPTTVDSKEIAHP